MNWKVLFACILLGFQAVSQTNRPASAIDQLSYGVVLEVPAMKDVVVKRDIPFMNAGNGKLTIDVYSPPGLRPGEKRPAIVFMTVFAPREGEAKMKTWGIYTSWPRLIAAHGYIGISMESDGSREAIEGLFSFLAEKGISYQVNTDQLGVYAASANVTQSFQYLMSEKVSKGIKAAVLYYGNSQVGPFRKDLPVLFFVAEGDVQGNGYSTLWNEVLKNKAPWTIKMGSGLPHAFDAYTDTDAGRKAVKETLSFWKDNLDPVPTPSWSYSLGRDVMGSMQLDRPKALRLLKEITDLNPRDVIALRMYGGALRQSRQLREAESVYQKIVEVQPDDAEALFALATISYLGDKPQQGESLVAKAVNSRSMNRIFLADLGYNLLVANKNKEAIVYYEKALAMGPRSFDFYNLACAYARVNEKTKALEALEQSVRNGFGTKQIIEGDADFDTLRSEERYKRLLATIQ
ncbi:MAG: tetratricopeptide repeat protein [Chitinophagaceae bacterium]|nr:tetratricopeptide repeat protein [Chitinophagaceae bacterium]